MRVPSAYSQEKIGNSEAVSIFDHHVVLSCLKASYGLSEKELEASTAKTRIAFTGTSSLAEFYNKFESTRSIWQPLISQMAKLKGFESIADYALDGCNAMRKELGLPMLPFR